MTEENEIQTKKEETAKKAKVITEYQKLVDAVKDLQRMTETDTYRQFVRKCDSLIETQKDLLLVAEKPRDIVMAQASVEVARKLIAMFREPVDTLNTYISGMPLFAGDFKTRASWNQERREVEIRTIG